ncbi:hypothetical protein M2451_002596 [Dysgonomonas sp. PFB1-18]|uniref:NUMOD4 domain-containing protein n=1 Tax=unclassified Dysgonomonas TaxID=2630389 RepID=UPI0024730C8F|nr:MULTISPECIES: NUMOD4 domain-containing protein [unclassified Dysgonomonas]MDH6308077.1 hypothetical protein [Dysgonomonas sp. PF1-14]MDH6339616.1 hypothetical protein [Dysgonomonas sp. PF1-16]MDH6381267.1 hypothetical protein [Dysgonomonas sp. PFB1-18]MDH6398479.1 hypothetical protein [Dysgonomonas sp. PF1-23]
MDEQWRPVMGYGGYEVSNLGNVRKQGQTKHLKRCTGYGMRRVVLRSGNDFHLISVAKLVLEAFTGKMPKGMKPSCMDGNYEHLELTNLCWVVRRQKKYKKTKRQPTKPSTTMEDLINRHSKYIKKQNGDGSNSTQ